VDGDGDVDVMRAGPTVQCQGQGGARASAGHGPAHGPAHAPCPSRGREKGKGRGT
jgi:hypothetical protein